MRRGRAIGWGALVTAGTAAAILCLRWLNRDSFAEEPPPEASEPSAAGSDLPADEPTEYARAQETEAPAQAAPAVPPTAVQANPPLQPEVRQHAKQIILPTAALAMDKGDVKKLYTVLQVANDQRSDELLSETDKGAIEAAIACLEDAPDAREEAADLLRFGAPTVLADNVRRACAAR